MPLENWIAERIMKRAGLEGAVCEPLLALLKSAREGRLSIAVSGVLPSPLWSDGSDPKKPLVIEGGQLYLQRTWAMKQKTLEKLTQLRARELPTISIDLAQYPLQPAQEQAISQAVRQSVSIFTGGPGTGKTYTAGIFIRLLAQAAAGPLKVIAAALTGKAAAHLESSLQSQGAPPSNLCLESTTLHRLLHLTPGRHRFLDEQTIDADLVVVDEASMLDLSLLLHLLYAIGPHTRLLLLGDPHQLPPIESGSLFPHIATLYGHKLERSMRMGDGALFSFAQAINQGDLAEVIRLCPHRIAPDFSLPARGALVQWLCSLVASPLHATQPDPLQCFAEQKKFRILGGLRKGPLGIDELNRLILDSYLRDFKEWIAIPILIVKNDLKQNLFNGTAGILIRKKGERFGTAHFDTGQSIAELALPQYEIGFCISVHKSQGSEFDEVLALFQPGSERFGKEALYTAVTRAKKKVTVAIDEATLLKYER